MKRLTRTVVGSFPSFDEKDTESSIFKIIDLQFQHGIDILSDGEQREDMITYFSKILPGLKHEGTTSRITGKISPPEDIGSFSKIKDFTLVKNYLDQEGKKNKIKVTITGPITLGFTCGINGLAGSPYSGLKDGQLYTDVSNALKPIVDELQKKGALVQIDEPGLSAGYVNYKIFSTELSQWINELTSELNPENTLMHVCGKLTKSLFEDVLVKFENIGALSFAFDGDVEKENINSISRKALEDNGKTLGFGCISGANAVLSNPETVKSNIITAVEKIGQENIKFIHPDCGLKVLSPDKAEMVLHNMNEGAKLFENIK